MKTKLSLLLLLFLSVSAFAQTHSFSTPATNQVGGATAQDQAETGSDLPPITLTIIPANNPLQVALLRWYPANLTTSFPVGAGPIGVAFDGASIWVTNADGNNVTKLKASDGTVLGTFNVGNYSAGMAFDGANIWVVNKCKQQRDRIAGQHWGDPWNLPRGKFTGRRGL